MREYLTGGKYREWIKKKKGDGNESSESGKVCHKLKK
jgi:hypothetical protein